ncbi:unnamed protein product [Acanthoscelides obtectus]|uniref:BOD1/SHG1 domain-containing protein n=1 Tax=Acanthoscelides obtectus TaxID=200917 RepID=A0A9P0LNI9_ACAOB|nr:unnamed protein product [Acanthoscelides obtectus]CAK1656332.1 Biorientation of chromosomes in cell division protein 1 [Acanthoscelides obtectus]
MDIVGSSYMPGDPRLVQQIVCELKSQGIFDQFRKECISDVDTKPAYQNLRQRVEGSVAAFLKEQTWCTDMNKNQVREQLRKSIYESGYLDMGVERIVDQVVNPKINTVFLPQVEEVVYRFLGLQKPVRTDVKTEETKPAPKVDIADLLPTDLEAISPESVKSGTEVDTADNSTLTALKTEEDESPPFEPLDTQGDPANLHEDNSVDSHLSGFSGLQSHDSNEGLNNTGISRMDLSNQDSQISQNSCDDRLSIDISEDTKMDAYSEPKIEKSTDSDTKMSNDVLPLQDIEFKFKDDKKSHKDIKYDRKHGEKKRDEKRETKSESKRDDKHNYKKKDKNADTKDKKDGKHVSRSSEKNSKSSSSSGSKEREKDRYKEGDRSFSKHCSKSKHKESDRKDTENVAKEEIDKGIHDHKDSDKKEAEKNDSDKKIKLTDVSLGRSDKHRKKEKDEKSSQEKSDKEDRSKDNSSRDKEDKNKSVGNNKEKSHKERNDKKELTVDKSGKSKEKGKSSSSGRSNKHHSDTNSTDKKKDGGKETKSSSNSSSKHKDKTNKSEDDAKSRSRHKKDSKRDKSRDDHYSFKDKKRNRRSTDRDSNDGNAERSVQNNVDNSMSLSQKHSSEAGDTSSVGGSNNSGNSEAVETENSREAPDDAPQKTQCNEVETVKYIKPKFASNLKEAMRIMKIRRQIAKLERQNQLSLVAIDSPHVNGIIVKDEDSTKEIEKAKICEKVLNIVLNRKDAMVQKVVTRKPSGEGDEVDDGKPVHNMEVADAKSEITHDQPKFILQTKDLSKERWEALEARLAEEMSNVDCRLYDYCDDYYSSDNEVMVSHVKTQQIIRDVEKHVKDEKEVTEQAEHVTSTDQIKNNSLKNDIQVDDDGTNLQKPDASLRKSLIEQNDNNMIMTLEEVCDSSTVGLDNEVIINELESEVIEEQVLTENIVNEEVIPTESIIEENVIDSNTPSVVEETGCLELEEEEVIAPSGTIDYEGDVIMTRDGVTVIQDVEVSEEIVGAMEIDKSDITEGLDLVEQVVEVAPDDFVEANQTCEISGPMIVLIAEEIINTEFESECRYLEAQSQYMKKNLENLYKLMKKLEDDVEHSIKSCQNNFAPSIRNKGTKRKLDVFVDVRNNNKHLYEENICSKGNQKTTPNRTSTL